MQLKFGCHNVLTMYGGATNHKELEKWLCEVAQYTVTSQLILLGLSEMRWNGAGKRNVDGNLCLIYSGYKETNKTNTSNNDEQPKKGNYGVGILMSKSAERHLVDWEPVSQRLLTATFKFEDSKVAVIQVYAPTLHKLAAEKVHRVDFYKKLYSITDRLIEKHAPECLVVMGDFNARIGSNNKGFEQNMGTHALQANDKDKLNFNGRLMLALCARYDLVVGGSLFDHDDDHKYTLTHNGGTRSQNDHILISNKYKHYLVDVRNHVQGCEGKPKKSNHEPVIATVQLPSNYLKRRASFDSSNLSGSKIGMKIMKLRHEEDITHQ